MALSMNGIDIDKITTFNIDVELIRFFLESMIGDIMFRVIEFN